MTIDETIEWDKDLVNKIYSLMLGAPHESELFKPHDPFGFQYVFERVSRDKIISTIRQGLEGSDADAFIGGECGCFQQSRVMESITEIIDGGLLQKGDVFYNIQLFDCGNGRIALKPFYEKVFYEIYESKREIKYKEERDTKNWKKKERISREVHKLFEDFREAVIAWDNKPKIEQVNDLRIYYSAFFAFDGTIRQLQENNYIPLLDRSEKNFLRRSELLNEYGDRLHIIPSFSMRNRHGRPHSYLNKFMGIEIHEDGNR